MFSKKRSKPTYVFDIVVDKSQLTADGKVKHYREHFAFQGFNEDDVLRKYACSGEYGKIISISKIKASDLKPAKKKEKKDGNQN